jgi:histidine ammonia-lyase
MNNKNTIVFNGQPLTIEDICRIAGQQAHVELSTQADFIKRIDKGALFIDALLKDLVIVW